MEKSKSLTNNEKAINAIILEFTDNNKNRFAFKMPSQNAKKIHILCTNTKTMKSAGIRVVTSNCLSNKIWLMNHKDIKDFRANSLFFVFTGINKITKIPDFFIVPSRTVLCNTDKEAKTWLGVIGTNEKLREDSGTRKFKIEPEDEQEYLNQWDLLELD